MTGFESDTRDYKEFTKKLLEDPEVVRQLRETLFKDWLKIPSQFKSSIENWLPLVIPDIPYSQVVGALKFTAEVATPVVTRESRTSATYGALTTAGPSLTGLSAGQYLFIFGFTGTNDTAGKAAIMNISFNGDTPADDNDAAWAANTPSTQDTTSTSWVTQSFTDDNNSAVAVYRSEAGTGETARFGKRRLLALRYANA